MISSRLASFLLFAISLGFLVCAAPSPVRDGQSITGAGISRRDSGSMASLTTLEGTTRKSLDDCMRTTTLEGAKKILDSVTVNIRSTTDSLVSKVKVNANSSAKTDLAVRTASVISTIAQKIDVKPEALKNANLLESSKLLGFGV
ncbi:unnamed protein product [Rhizoctonia solani]|uniref:Uncharacterized protein n=1 Tax=Rhizoctonia solani TaxID=456999 RepID=A0A8H3BJ76_9AGAM|nr:unnamed protein product [Rhizoctonia solani]